MKPDKILGAALTLFAIIVWYGPATVWGAGVTLAHQPGVELSADQYEDLAKGPAPMAYLRDRSEKQSLFGAQYSKKRYVSYVTSTHLDKILQDGEARPDPLYYDAYAEARAAMTLSPNCQELLATIARDCQVFSSEGNYQEDTGPDAVVNLAAKLSYIPRYEMGDPATIANGRFRNGALQFNVKSTLNPQRSRLVVLGRAMELCEELRKTFGTCVIETIRFREGQAQKAATRWHRQIRGSIYFAVYADERSVTREDVKDAIDLLSAEMSDLKG
ncbi:MAG: hypothetical protein AAF641_11830 [Pseudomonadota bacterium]